MKLWTWIVLALVTLTLGLVAMELEQKTRFDPAMRGSQYQDPADAGRP